MSEYFRLTATTFHLANASIIHVIDRYLKLWISETKWPHVAKYWLAKQSGSQELYRQLYNLTRNCPQVENPTLVTDAERDNLVQVLWDSPAMQHQADPNRDVEWTRADLSARVSRLDRCTYRACAGAGKTNHGVIVSAGFDILMLEAVDAANLGGGAFVSLHPLQALPSPAFDALAGKYQTAFAMATNRPSMMASIHNHIDTLRPASLTGRNRRREWEDIRGRIVWLLSVRRSHIQWESKAAQNILDLIPEEERGGIVTGMDTFVSDWMTYRQSIPLTEDERARQQDNRSSFASIEDFFEQRKDLELLRFFNSVGMSLVIVSFSPPG